MQETTSMQQDAENVRIPTLGSRTETWALKSRSNSVSIVLCIQRFWRLSDFCTKIQFVLPCFDRLHHQKEFAFFVVKIHSSDTEFLPVQLGGLNFLQFQMPVSSYQLQHQTLRASQIVLRCHHKKTKVITISKI